MARVEYDVRFEGTHEDVGVGLALRLRAIGADMSRDIKALLTKADLATREVLKEQVPYDAEGGHMEAHTHLVDTIRSSGIVYRPGGAGGGGFYEVEINVGMEGLTPQLGYVLQGTGIYNGGERITAGEGNLGEFIGNVMSRNPFHHAQAMPMYGGKRVGSQLIFRTSTRGQEPQTAWLSEAHAMARRVISQGVRDIGRRR